MSLLPTPQEFAESLGLEPGINAGRSKLLTTYEMVHHGSLSLLINARLRSGQSLLPFWRELGSIYLPSLFRTFCSIPYRDVTADTALCYTSLLLLVHRFATEEEPGVDSRTFERFTRAHPDEAVRFYYTMCQNVVDGDRTKPGFAFRTQMQITCSILMTIFYVHDVLKSRSVLHKHRDEFPSDLAPRFAALRTSVTGPQNLQLFDLSAGALDSALDASWGSSPMRVPYGPTASYTCEASKEGYPRGLAQYCVKPAEGSEFAECARCRCVRYCSKTHQRQHWKEHKLLCFPPGW